jgi:hypothetical protein
MLPLLSLGGDKCLLMHETMRHTQSCGTGWRLKAYLLSQLQGWGPRQLFWSENTEGRGIEVSVAGLKQSWFINMLQGSHSPVPTIIVVQASSLGICYELQKWGL